MNAKTTTEGGGPLNETTKPRSRVIAGDPFWSKYCNNRAMRFNTRNGDVFMRVVT